MGKEELGKGADVVGARLCGMLTVWSPKEREVTSSGLGGTEASMDGSGLGYC
jgi:hypothetical protein